MKQINLLEELIVDNFAGGGGASTGIELATGRPVDIAINHDPDAIAMHKANHRRLRKHLFGQICRKCAGRKLKVWKNYGML